MICWLVQREVVPATVRFGTGLVFIVLVAVALQPLGREPVTVYTVCAVGFATVLAVLAPLLQA